MSSEQDNEVKLKKQYKDLFEELNEILFRQDPIGINFEENTDEYDPEVGTILPRLKEALCEADVHDIVYQEFVRWFDPITAGSKEKYRNIAQEIWRTWKKHNQ